jgi:hypothetical protein
VTPLAPILKQISPLLSLFKPLQFLFVWNLTYAFFIMKIEKILI